MLFWTGIFEILATAKTLESINTEDEIEWEAGEESTGLSIACWLE